MFNSFDLQQIRHFYLFIRIWSQIYTFIQCWNQNWLENLESHCPGCHPMLSISSSNFWNRDLNNREALTSSCQLPTQWPTCRTSHNDVDYKREDTLHNRFEKKNQLNMSWRVGWMSKSQLTRARKMRDKFTAR